MMATNLKLIVLRHALECRAESTPCHTHFRHRCRLQLPSCDLDWCICSFQSAGIANEEG